MYRQFKCVNKQGLLLNVHHVVIFVQAIYWLYTTAVCCIKQTFVCLVVYQGASMHACVPSLSTYMNVFDLKFSVFFVSV